MEPKETKPNSLTAANLTGKSSRRNLIIGLLVIAAVVAVGYLYFTKTVSNYQECANKYPNKVLTEENRLTCTVFGRTYTSSTGDSQGPILDKTYSDNAVSFKYPSAWKIKKGSNPNAPGSYFLSIDSNQMNGHLVSGNTNTMFQLNSTLWLADNKNQVPVCNNCTAQAPQHGLTITLSNPTVAMEPVFGINSAIFGSPVIMSLNNTQLSSGSKNYTASVSLPGGKKLATRAIMSFQYNGKTVHVANTNDFLKSPTYPALVAIYSTMIIK